MGGGAAPGAWGQYAAALRRCEGGVAGRFSGVGVVWEQREGGVQLREGGVAAALWQCGPTVGCGRGVEFALQQRWGGVGPAVGRCGSGVEAAEGDVGAA